MKKRAVTWIIIAVILVIIGSATVAAAMFFNKWDFSGISSAEYETNTHELSESFTDISVNTYTANILFVPSEDGKCRVECYEKTNLKHTVSISGGKLSINAEDETKWYDNIGDFSEDYITIYLPESQYVSLFINSNTSDIEIPKDFGFQNIDISLSTGDVKNYASASDRISIETTTGLIYMENVSTSAINLAVTTGDIFADSVKCKGDINIIVSTGKVKLNDVRCTSLISNGNTGDIFLENVIAEKMFSVERSTGDIILNKSDAEEIFVTTDTGDVKGSLLNEKVFIISTDTGDVNVPGSVNGGRCEITTDTGDINLSVRR